MNASGYSRAFSPMGFINSKNDSMIGDNNWMSLGDKRRHKRNVLSNGRWNSRLKKKNTRGKYSIFGYLSLFSNNIK